jgi:hypothetical protein
MSKQKKCLATEIHEVLLDDAIAKMSKQKKCIAAKIRDALFVLCLFGLPVLAHIFEVDNRIILVLTVIFISLIAYFDNLDSPFLKERKELKEYFARTEPKNK